MLHTSKRDKEQNLNQLSLPSSSFCSLNHSYLTAALQDAGDGHGVAGQVEPGGQLDNVVSWGVGNHQWQTTIDTNPEASHWKSTQRLMDPLANCGLASSNKPQLEQRPDSSNNAPWNHYRALSAPQTDLVGSWGHHGEGHEALQPGITGINAPESFDGSWSASYLQSPITPFPSTSFGAADVSLLAFDDSLAMPTENENYLPSRPCCTQRLDHSRSSSLSKGAQARSRLDPPISSNQSIEEEEIHDGIEISMEGIDFDEEAQQTCQPDFANLLSGLKSPFQQRRDRQSDALALVASQEPAEWLLNDTVMGANLEGITEPFPNLLRSDDYPSQGPDRDGSLVNFIAIPASSDKFRNGLTSSYPPTDYHWPPSHESKKPLSRAPEPGLTRARGFTLSTARPCADEAHLPALPIRNKSNRSKPMGVSRRSRRSSVSDNKKSVALTRVSSGLRRGVRDGQLPHAKALEIAQKRENKSVCIACKSARVTCKYSTPDMSSCNKCLKLGSICTRANFAEMTDSQTCNPIFQTCCMHLTFDACRRVTIPYPNIIDADWLLNQLTIHQTQCNIRIISVTGAVWEIDLRKCYELLSKLPWKGGTRRLPLDMLVHNRRMSLAAWLDCMKAGRDDTDFEQFLKYTNMPSHNTYSFLSLNAHERSRQMSADDPKDRQFILMGSQLCRIITRALEMKGFRDLQKELGDFTRLDTSDIEAALSRTGRLLGTLRWRLALSELVSEEFSGVVSSDRVKKITHVLYFWFLFVKRRLPEENQNQLPKGDWSTYVNVGTIWDDFPQDESPEGFQKWIRGSHKRIEDTYSLPHVASMSASGLIKEPVSRQAPGLQSSFPEWQMPLEPRKNSYYDPTSGLNYEF